jgi:hypothetical protein
MDLPSNEKRFYKGIEFELSSLFKTKRNPKYTLKTNSFAEYIPELNIYFSIELFSKKEGLKIKKEFTENTNILDAINDNYIYKREASLYNPYTSVKKPLPPKIKYKGFVQVIQGETNKGGIKSSYFTSTIQIKNKYYVIQLIGPKDNMGYFYDDFNDLLFSIKNK